MLHENEGSASGMDLPVITQMTRNGVHHHWRLGESQ